VRWLVLFTSQKPDNWYRNLEHVLSQKSSKSSFSATRGFNSESWCPMFKLILSFGALANWTLIRWYHPLVMEYQVWVSAARQTIWLPVPGTIRFLTFPSKSLLVSMSYTLSSYGTPLPILSSWKLLQRVFSLLYHMHLTCDIILNSWYGELIVFLSSHFGS